MLKYQITPWLLSNLIWRQPGLPGGLVCGLNAGMVDPLGASILANSLLWHHDGHMLLVRFRDALHRCIWQVGLLETIEFRQYICNLQSLLKTFGIFSGPYSLKNLPRQFATNLRLCKKAWVCLDISSCKRILHSWLGRPSMAVSCHSWLDIITWETKALAFVWCSAGRCCSHWQFKFFKV